MNEQPLRKLLRENPLVITGMGAFSAAGESVEALWRSAVAGLSLAEWMDFGTGHPTGRAKDRFAVCRAPAIDLTRPELRSVRKMDRCVQMALLAAREACLQAGLNETLPFARAGVMVGSSRGPCNQLNAALEQFKSGRYPPSLSANTTFASLSGALSQAFKFKGPGATIAATCASSALAIGLAAEQILLGKADVMLVGGTEAPLQYPILGQLAAAGVLGTHAEARQACRPFDITRNGLILGEGSAFLVLESAANAAKRGAKPLARLTGWAMSLDNAGRTAVMEDGAELRRVMQQAVELAGLQAADIDYINAHGTGTVMNDAAESEAVRQFLGTRTAAVPCSSTKPVTGHCLGATSALEAVIAITAMQWQMVPPTANCTQPDPQCAIQVQPLKAGPAILRHVMSNSLGFWGYHAALVFSRMEE